MRIEAPISAVSGVFDRNESAWGHQNTVHDHLRRKKRYRIFTRSTPLTIWICIGYSGIIASDVSESVISSERYCDILTNNIVPNYRQHEDKFFQQDGAPPHYSVNATNILN